ncbi:alpha-sarcoglycan isoform X3 [Falco rusticolus]|uniref:alpha-sarcoglycan isoform X3 n=1 Tax=Falco rusticolus TaxID=120794 RepID=UPI000FFC8E73|nr:alpha-sarcoglycan isoform X3 [Falco rusticolus]
MTRVLLSRSHTRVQCSDAGRLPATHVRGSQLSPGIPPPRCAPAPAAIPLPVSWDTRTSPPRGRPTGPPLRAAPVLPVCWRGTRTNPPTQGTPHRTPPPGSPSAPRMLEGHQDEPTQGTPHRTPCSGQPQCSPCAQGAGCHRALVAGGGPGGVPRVGPPQADPPVTPLPGQPRCLRQSALAPLPEVAKMEAPKLLRAWVLAVMALGESQATLPNHHVLPNHRVSSETGAIFVHELERELFQDAFLTGHEDDGAAPITFQAHLQDHPDLPRWLRYIQRDPHQPGYLYGCPMATEVGTHTIEVLAYNRHTYETAAQHLVITIFPAPGGEPPYQGEFLVGNRNVEELLPVAMRDIFLQATAGVWERDDLHVINVTSTLDRGGRVPLPIEGRKEGVYVKVGSHGAFSSCLAAATSPQSRFRCSLGQQPLASCYDTFAPHFTIRWCNLTLAKTGLGDV